MGTETELHELAALPELAVFEWKDTRNLFRFLVHVYILGSVVEGFSIGRPQVERRQHPTVSFEALSFETHYTPQK